MDSTISDKIYEFFSKYPQRSYPKGQILVFADESPEHIYYIQSGKVRKYGISYRGDEVIVNIFKPPAFFPMSWALNRTPNKYFYKTEAATVVHIVPANDALQFLKDNPDVTLDLLSRIYRGMDGLLGRIVHLMSGTAKSRLIYELVTECRRFGEQQKDGSYLLNVSELDLAARAGMSRETVSREMRKLKDLKLISLDSQKMTVKDLAGLEKALGTEV
jgi:CRP/FNR family transcriptional regulator